MPFLPFFRRDKDRKHPPTAPSSPTTPTAPSNPPPSTVLAPPPTDGRPVSPFARLAKRASRTSMHSSHRAAKSPKSVPPPLPLSSTTMAIEPPLYSPLLPPPRIFGLSFGNGSTQSLPPARHSVGTPPTVIVPASAPSSPPARPDPTPTQQPKQPGFFHSWKRHPKQPATAGLLTPGASSTSPTSSDPPRPSTSASSHKRDSSFALKSFRPIRPPSPPPTLGLGTLPSPLSMSPAPSPSASQVYVASPTSLSPNELQPPPRPRTHSVYSDSSSARSVGGVTTVGQFKQQARRSSTNVSVIPPSSSSGPGLSPSPPVSWRPISPSSPPIVLGETTPERPPRPAPPPNAQRPSPPNWQATAASRRRSAALAAAWRGPDTSTSDESEEEEEEDDETLDGQEIEGLGRQATITQAGVNGNGHAKGKGKGNNSEEARRKKKQEASAATLVRMNSDGRPAWERRTTSPTAPAARTQPQARARPRPEKGRASLDTTMDDLHAQQQQQQRRETAPPTAGMYRNRRASASAGELVRPVSVAVVGGVSPVKSAMKKPSPSSSAGVPFTSGGSTTTASTTTGAATGTGSSSDSDDVPLGVRKRVLSGGLSPPRAPALQNGGGSGRDSPSSTHSSSGGRTSAGAFRRQSLAFAGGVKAAPAVLGRPPAGVRRASSGGAQREVEAASLRAGHKRAPSESSLASSSQPQLQLTPSPSTITAPPPHPPSAYSPLSPPHPPPWSDSPGSSAGGSAVSARSSGSGSGSRGRGPLTPRDGMDGVPSVVGVGRRSVSFVGVGKEEEESGKEEERRRERRRGEAKAAIDLANIVNGPGPSLAPDDSDLPAPSVPPPVSAPQHPSLAQTGLLNPLFPSPPPSVPSAVPFSSPYPTMASPPTNPYFLPTPPGMNPYFPPTPSPFAPDPNVQYLAAAHQQALFVARQTFQMTMAQQAMSAAGAAWDMNMSVASASALGTPVGSVFGTAGGGGSELGWAQQQQQQQQQSGRRERRESLFAGQLPQQQQQQQRQSSNVYPTAPQPQQQQQQQQQPPREQLPNSQSQNPNRLSRAVPPVQLQTARGRSW